MEVILITKGGSNSCLVRVLPFSDFLKTIDYMIPSTLKYLRIKILSWNLNL